jgi:hypothetical protein
VGTVPFNTVFNLATAQVQQQDSLAVAQGNIALNLINVYRALGGGWELRYEKDGCGEAPSLAGVPPGETLTAPAQESLPAPKPLPQSR